jgi:hypothetical protein
MPNKSVNINTDAAVIFSNKLEKLHRSALPIAIRNTLNTSAFVLKTKEMPKSYGTVFEKRRKGFEKKFSVVQKANGFNTNTMKAIVGFKSNGIQAVEDLEQQEKGGIISGRSFIPMDSSRISNNNRKNVRPKNRLPNIRFKKVKKGGKKQRSTFIRTAFKLGKGGFILYGSTLFEVKGINNKSTGRNKIKLLALYSFEKGRKVKVKGTKFMSKSSNKVALKMEDVYIAHAKKQINKALKK